MDPRIWGPGAWHLLHRISIRNKEKEFYMSLKYILPCDTCRKNIEKHFAKLPFPSNKGHVSKWIYDLHNLVNDDLDVGNSNRPTFSEIVQLKV